MNSAWSKVSQSVKQFGTLALSYLGYQFIAGKIQSGIRAVYDLSDAFANVRKTTGLSAAEMERLNAELGKLDTRTARKDLLDLAAVAGKLGISGVENIKQFVSAADKLNVALGEDLGQDGVQNLGKINDLFGKTKELGIEQSLLKVGSAINSLGQAGSAQESYIVDFTKRLAGVSVEAGITLPNLLGLATTLDELGQQSETSSTAISQLFIKMQKDSDTYAKIAGLNVKEFNEAIGSDANEAFIMFLKGLQNNSNGLKDLATNFSALGIDGSRAIAVISALSQNTDKLTEKQALANQEYNKGTSVIDEFNVKNNNAAAQLDKITKKLSSISLTISQSFADAFIKLGGAIIGVRTQGEELVKQMQEERQELGDTVIKLYDVNLKHEDRIKLINELKNKYPEYLKNLNAETATNQDLFIELNKVNEALINRIIIQKQQNKIDEQNEVVADKRVRLMQLEKYLRQDIARAVEKYSYVLQDGLTTEQQAAAALDWLQRTTSKYDILVTSLSGDLDDYRGMVEIVKDAEAKGNKMLEKKNEMMQELGINTTTAATTGATAVKSLNEQLKDLEKILSGLTADSPLRSAIEDRIRDIKKKIGDATTGGGDPKDSHFKKGLIEILTGTAHEISETSKEHYETLKAQADNYYEAQKKLEDAAFQATLSDNEREQVAIMQKYDALREMADQFGLDTTGIQKAMEAELLALQKKANDDQIKEESAAKKKLSKIDQQYWDGRIALISAYGDVVIQSLNALGAAAGKDLEFQKAAALAQIAIDTGVAIAGAVAQNATHSLSPIDFAVKLGAQIAAILGAIGTAVGYFKNTEIPKYAKGRRTDGPEVAMIGEEGTEYVIPTNPRYRPQAIELLSSAMRDIAPVRGFNPSMPAGFRTGLTGGSSFAVNYPGEQMMMKTMYELKKEMAMLRDLLEEGVEARLDYDKFTRSLERISASKRRAGVIG